MATPLRYVGCGSLGVTYIPISKDVNIISIDEIQNAELRDTILKKAKVYSIPVIVLESEAVVSSYWKVPPAKISVKKTIK